MAIMIGYLDQGNPMHLHPNDSNCASIVSLKLTGVDNYRIRTSAMKLALQIKHKMGFITVKKTHDRVDGSIVFNLLQKINTFKQGGLLVSEYYHKLNSLWREFDILTKLPDCTCVARAELVDHGRLLRLMQFLMGLDDVYQPIRSNILTREILPEAKDSFVIISRKSRIGVYLLVLLKLKKPQASAFVSRTNDNNRRRTDGNWSNNNGSNVNKGNYDSMLCKKCCLKGHTVDRCFEIIGYPPCFKRNPNLKPSGNFNNNKTNFADTEGNNDIKTSAGTVSLTNDQVMKLMSLLNDKSGSSANAHMTINVSELNLTICHPNGTLAKITHVGNLRLNSNVVLFDVLIIHEYIDLKKKKVMGTGSESAGLYLFDSDCAKSAMCIDRGIPLMFWTECVLTATYLINMLPSLVLNGKSLFFVVYGREPYLSHLKSFGCLCFATMVKGSDKFSHRSEKCVLIGYASGKKAYKVFSPENRNSLYSRDVKFYETVFPYKMNNNESENINLFYHFKVELETKTSNLSPNEEEEGSPGRDGRVHQPMTDDNTDRHGYDGTHPATPIDENNVFEGNVGTSDEVPVFQIDLTNTTAEVGPRRSQRASKLPAKLNEFVLDGKVKYGLNRYANHSVLSSKNYGFVSNLNKSVESSSYEEALKDINWINAMNEEMNALYENKTWIMTDLPLNRKPIGSKPVMTPLPENLVLNHKETDIDNQHMHALLKSHFDIALRVLKYLKLAPGLGVEFAKRNNDYVISAYSIAANPVMYEKTKHFDIDVHLVREKVASGLIKIIKVDTKSQVADILTKALGTYRHSFLVKKLGLLNMLLHKIEEGC
ncbi:ribonuclease H-like domain-containing protein [Tanacetum coccineum]